MQGRDPTGWPITTHLAQSLFYPNYSRVNAFFFVNREQIKAQALWAATEAVLLIQEHKVSAAVLTVCSVFVHGPSVTAVF